MGWTWNKEYLDVILVPNLSVSKKEKKKKVLTSTPLTRFEISNDLQIESKDRSQALTVINNNISAAFSLSSISLVVSSLIGTWFGTSPTFTSTLIYGYTSLSIIAFKHISLLICFLVAFVCFLQSARCYVHSSFLITMPNADIPKECVQDAVVYGINCWLFGMRALYFAVTLLLWVFGPIPMFVSFVVMVVVLYNLDWNTTPLLPFPTEGQAIMKTISQEMTTVGRAIVVG
ncbi:hypothetical protein Vadar_011208 [Vaccinium darrowii]|uniref:Uncharacterized protein n=1 Tax=Vaccinium darrowii TaxID=229202 RepID=A0ACB7XR87_9ERIC|nr:hypothetical protein Vadar_011208 [Vaccinium darrowii]